MIVIGSRGSQLALWQAHHIQACLQALGAETRIEIIKTSGDRIQDVPLAKVGGKGLFTKEIEEALLDRSIDLAVHSMKDVPTDLPDGLIISAIPEREEPRDALIGSRVDQLRAGMRVGTSSLRRSSQLMLLARGLKIDLKIEMLRGNVDTRLRKLDEGQYDAIVLAAAGLRRLGWENRITDLIPPEIMCPAVGQGALAIETRDDGGPAQHLARQLDHAASRSAVTAERALLRVLGGGCQVPVGAHASVTPGTVQLTAIVAHPDGSHVVRGQLSGSDPEQVGATLGRTLLDQGAREILREVYSAQ
ncbi:MAG: hydroxymethylbilane synthase [Acidobacteriota bacterium]